MVGSVKQNFVQAAAIKDFATFGALRKMLFFFGRKLFVFLTCHRVWLASIRSGAVRYFAWLGVCGGTNYLEHFVRLRKHRHVTAFELIGGRAHALCQGPL